MIKILPLLIFLFLTRYTSAQKCEYAAYFRYTDIAKNDFKQKNFKKARKNFKMAFQEIDFLLGHDLSYALIAANEIKDDEWAGQIAEKLAQGGTPFKYFVKFKKKKWFKDFELNFQNYVAHYEGCFDKEMRIRFLEIAQDDFEFTNTYHKWRARKIELSLQELIDGATKILIDFKSFNKKYGFPNEQKMGYNYVRGKNRIEPYKVDVLMIHVYQMGTPIYKDSIHNLVCEGALHMNFEKQIEKIQGFGDGTGIKQEMKARYKKYRGRE